MIPISVELHVLGGDRRRGGGGPGEVRPSACGCRDAQGAVMGFSPAAHLAETAGAARGPHTAAVVDDLDQEQGVGQIDGDVQACRVGMSGAVRRRLPDDGQSVCGQGAGDGDIERAGEAEVQAVSELDTVLAGDVEDLRLEVRRGGRVCSRRRSWF